MADVNRAGDSPASVKELCSASNLEKEKDNTYFKQVCAAALSANSDLPGFPKTTDILSDREKDIADAAVKAADLERALNNKTLGLSAPKTKELVKILHDEPAAGREAIAKAYETKNQRSLLGDLGNRYDKRSEDYHVLKGLLLRSDSPNSLAAVELHQTLKKIEATSDTIETTTEGAVGGLSRSKPGGVIAVLDLGVSLLGRAARRGENKSLGAYLDKMSASDINEMKSEHMRIYRRDLADMVENTKGLSKEAKQVFLNKGIQ